MRSQADLEGRCRSGCHHRLPFDERGQRGRQPKSKARERGKLLDFFGPRSNARVERPRQRAFSKQHRTLYYNVHELTAICCCSLPMLPARRSSGWSDRRSAGERSRAFGARPFVAPWPFAWPCVAPWPFFV